MNKLSVCPVNMRYELAKDLYEVKWGNNLLYSKYGEWIAESSRGSIFGGK